MIKIQDRIEELEKRAAEKELLSLLATDRAARVRSEQLARNFRLAALRLLTRRVINPVPLANDAHS